MNKGVNSEMVQLARDSRGMTQSELALKSGISQGHLSKLERGESECTDEQLKKLSKALAYPQSFFLQQEKRTGPGVSGVYHRKRLTLSHKQLRQLMAQIDVWTLELRLLLQECEVTLVNKFPQYDIDKYGNDPCKIARLVRAEWKLPMGSVRNLVDVIESAGGVVVKCDFGSAKFDAQSHWFSNFNPFFFVNKTIPGDRMRFTLAHEMGHLIMHSRPNDKMERQAHEFAAEFLMPKEDIRMELEDLTLAKAARLKTTWGTSMSALIRRAKDIGILSDSQYRRMLTKMGALGYRVSEPIVIPQENTTMLRKIIDCLRSEYRYSYADIAKHIHCNLDEFLAAFVAPVKLRYG